MKLIKGFSLSPNRLLFFLNKKTIRVEKRYRFAISTFFLVFFILLATFFPFDKALLFIPFLLLLSYVLTFFSVLDGSEKNRLSSGNIGWFGLFFMPLVTTIAFYGFYFLVPGRWLTRIPFIIFYAISIYAILLSSNIFNIGVEKNLQLYRAAFSVNFFYQAVTIFFLFNLIFSFQQYFIINIILIGIIVFLFALQLFWTIRLKKYIEKEIFLYAILLCFVLMELVLIISFVPLKSAISALFLTSIYYSLSGLTYHFVDSRLFKETMREYIIVLVFVFIITFLSLSW